MLDNFVLVGALPCEVNRLQRLDHEAWEGALMITVPELASEALGSFLATHLSRRFRSTEAHLTELIPSVARLSLECIGNSDALYHNVEHTMLVTLVGYDIMKGRALLT